jgi:hypothetical protein
MTPREFVGFCHLRRMRAQEHDADGSSYRFAIGPYVGEYEYDRKGGLATVHFEDGRKGVGRVLMCEVDEEDETDEQKEARYIWIEEPTAADLVKLRLYG